MPLEIRVGDVLTMKKPHPCGGREWQVLRVGMDLRLRCLNCGRELLLPRSRVEKGVRSVEKADS